MKRKFILVLALCCTSAAFGQSSKKVAVYATGECDAATKKVISAKMTAAIVADGEYRVAERADAFLTVLQQEHAYERSGNVEQSQISALGEQYGVNFICAVEISKLYGALFVSARLINLRTGVVVATAEKDKEIDGMSDLVEIAEDVAAQLVVAGQKTSSSNKQSRPPTGKTNGSVYSPDGIEMVYVEGTGSGILATQSFYIGKYEVTQAQYQAIMGTNPSNFTGANKPVEMVSWNDAQEFVTKLKARTGRNYRLPTEAEWEYAAREGNKNSSYEYSGSDGIGAVAWYDGNSGGTTHPVGQKLPNALGIYDMSGNVWEWCQDWYTEGSGRVLRGGSWIISAMGCRVSFRRYNAPGARGSNLGFRLVLPL